MHVFKRLLFLSLDGRLSNHTYTRWLHWFHIHIIFFCCFYQLSKIIFCSSWWTSNRFQTLKSSYSRCSFKKPVFENLAILIGKAATFLTQLFSCKYCKIFKEIYFKGHLWTTASEQWLTKKRDVFRDDNQRHIQSLLKHLRRVFLQKQSTVFNHWLFLQNTSYYLFHREYALIKLNKILVSEAATRRCSVKKGVLRKPQACNFI